LIIINSASSTTATAAPTVMVEKDSVSKKGSIALLTGIRGGRQEGVGLDRVVVVWWLFSACG
jgi:hypothetical protein